MRKVLPVLLLLFAACTRIVTTTTSEVRPSRYALLEFERQIPRDSMFSLVRRSIEAERMTLRDADSRTGIITAGPVHVAARDGQPALDADLNISTQAVGRSSRVRIFASAVLAPDQTGGQDARLMELAQRIERRLR